MYYALSLDEYPTTEAAFAAVPADTTRLNLAWNNLGEKITDDLVLIFSKIPAHVRLLDLEYNDLYKKTAADLALLFAGIPLSVISLDLSHNHLNRIAGFHLARALIAIPLSVKSLDLSHNNFDRIAGADLARTLVGISKGPKSLNLSSNYLYLKFVADWLQIFSRIPKNVTSLSLSNNKLHHISDAELIEIFSEIPPHIAVLNLSQNKLYQKPAAKILWMCAVIFSGFLCLNAISRHLNLTVDSHFWTIFFVLTQSALLIHLAWKRLTERDNAEIAQILSAIPHTVKRIELYGNKLFYGKKPSNIDDLLVALGDIRCRLDLRKNGESESARLIAPLASMVSEGRLNTDIAGNICSFWAPGAVGRFRFEMDKHCDHVQGRLL
jgi:hypothetical protein